MIKPKISETDIEPEIVELIQSCTVTAARMLNVSDSDAATIVAAVDECVFQLQDGEGPKLSEEEEPEYLFGSLWGQQLVRQLGWQWANVVFHEYDDSEAVGVFSPDRALAIYPFHFIHGCLENDAPVTIALAFNMLVDGKKIPKLPSKGYENVMDNVNHIVLVTDRVRMGTMNDVAGVLEFSLHLVPTGAALDYATQGNTKEAVVSAAGDIAAVLTLGAGKVFQVGRTSLKVSSNLSKVGNGIETGIGIYRGAQGSYKIARGEGGQGELAEAVLRLDGVSVSLVGAAPKSGVSSFMQGGRVPGTPLTAAEFDALRSSLHSDDVWLSVGKLDANGNIVIKFRPNELGKAELHLPANATHYEKLHEIGHFEHWMSLGKNYDEWIKLSQVDRERWVLDWMRKKHWNSLSSPERTNAIQQLLHALRKAGEL